MSPRRSLDERSLAPEADPQRSEAALAYCLPGGGLLVLGSTHWHALELTGDVPSVRVRIDRWGEHLVITGVAALADGALSATALRAVPLVRVQALLDHPVWALRLAEGMRRARIDSSDLSPEGDVGPGDVPYGEPTPAPPENYVIPGATGLTKPDDFYSDVATAWSVALASGHTNPAPLLAEQNGVTPASVHRWIRVARQRGLLAPSPRTPRASAP